MQVSTRPVFIYSDEFIAWIKSHYFLTPLISLRDPTCSPVLNAFMWPLIDFYDQFNDRYRSSLPMAKEIVAFVASFDVDSMVQGVENQVGERMILRVALQRSY